MQKRSLSLSSYIITTISLASLISIIFIILVSNKISAQTLLSTTNESYQLIKQWGSYGTDDGQFNDPNGISVDAFGNVYVADSDNSRIQKFDSNGKFVRQWGSYGSDNGQFINPFYIATDNDSVYVEDSGNNRIQKFDSNGNFITAWNYGFAKQPHDITVDKSGNVYMTFFYDDKVEKFDSNGNFITKWGSYGSDKGQFYGPTAIAVDSSNNVYVFDYYNDNLQKFDSNGKFLTSLPISAYGGLENIVVDSNNNIYSTDKAGEIQKFDSNGKFLGFIINSTSNTQGDNPSNIAVDDSGKVYVAESQKNMIEVFAPDLHKNNNNVEKNQINNKTLFCNTSQHCPNPLKVSPYSATNMNNKTNTISKEFNQTTKFINYQNTTSITSKNTKVQNNQNKTIQTHVGISDQF